ncbi:MULTISPECIES: hypothetical protein [unclassified Mesorhizobium]|uniref:hypothetical protein n=1 Tax=Mesorhizobium sp. B2-8-1 TaxID=2589906 RepID=UPI001FEFDCA2|nr:MULTISPECIES: hypothetical protein [unclassified Mesorhizobium]
MASDARNAPLKRESRRQHNALVRPLDDAGFYFGDDVTAQKAVDLLETQLSGGEPWRERLVPGDGRGLGALSCGDIDSHALRKRTVQSPAHPDAVARRGEGNRAIQGAGQVVGYDPNIRNLKSAQLKNLDG